MDMQSRIRQLFQASIDTKQQAMDALAMTAATYDTRVGREWRAMQDTVNDPIITQRRPIGWRSWQRSEDYYVEGQLIGLDAETGRPAANFGETITTLP